MRIVFMNSARDWGGAENWSLILCAGLAERGHEVSFICHPDGAMRRRAGEDTRFEVVPVRIRAELDPVRVARLAKEIRSRQPHLVAAYRTKDVKLGVAANWLAGGPPFVHAHHAPYRLKDSRTYRFFWTRGVRAMAVPSKTSREMLRANAAWLDGMTIRVIHNGVDTDQYRPRPELRDKYRRELGIAADAFVLSYHGRIEPRKQVDLMIKAVAEAAKHVSAHAVVVGDGPQADEVRRLAAELSAPATFTGFRDDVPMLLSAADAAAHLSTSEGLPLSVLEAMASGLPVIASNATSHAEQIRDGEDGFLVAPRDSSAVAEAILQLATDPARRERMGSSALRRAEERFSIEAMVGGYEDFFQEFGLKS